MTATQEISWIARAAVCPTRVTSIQRLFPPTFTVLQSVVWLEAVQLLKCYGAWCLCITLCVFGYLGYLNSTCQLFRVSDKARSTSAWDECQTLPISREPIARLSCWRTRTMKHETCRQDMLRAGNVQLSC